MQLLFMQHQDRTCLLYTSSEAQAAAGLEHPNIVNIYDVGSENGIHYIVMEYVPGQTLKELIHKRGALHYVEAVDIMKQVVSATAKAHAIGIIHRDLKPQNIMVTDSGVVKIGDFGIASIPVSYTHLDVYKRQHYKFFRTRLSSHTGSFIRCFHTWVYW